MRGRGRCSATSISRRGCRRGIPCIEEAFGWIKTIAGQSRTKLRGLDRVRWSFTLAATAYNLIRLPKLIEATA